jgi:hypothetical protein
MKILSTFSLQVGTNVLDEHTASIFIKVNVKSVRNNVPFSRKLKNSGFLFAIEKLRRFFTISEARTCHRLPGILMCKRRCRTNKALCFFPGCLRRLCECKKKKLADVNILRYCCIHYWGYLFNFASRDCALSAVNDKWQNKCIFWGLCCVRRGK